MADQIDLYPVIAQIAAAFAGFGSLASGIGRRRGGDDARMDAYRLQHMLQASLSATLLGLLPATLIGPLGDGASAIRISALAAITAILIYVPPSIVRARRLRHVAGFSVRATVINSLCVWGAFFAFLLCVIDYPRGLVPSLYLIGLMGLLASTVMLFSRVIVSMLRPHS